MKVGIINVSGYAGSELAGLLLRHSEAEIVAVTGRSAAGKRVPEILPYLWELDMPITKTIETSVDVVFSALPSGASAEVVVPIVKSGVRAVDIAADFRLHDPEIYQEAYGLDQVSPDLLSDAVYGLPELNRDAIKGASLVANPGCYPTASILALAPAVRHGIVNDDVIIDAKSGISGAGRGGISASTIDQFAEANENVVAYALDGHGHRFEIAQELAGLRGTHRFNVTFVPHRIPMTRGIMATCYASLKEPSFTKEDVFEIYRDFYNDERFVNVTDQPPHTKHTVGSNFCLIHPTVDKRTNRLIVVSCIDNLVKGAAGQAVQNMNLMFGLNEDEGLTRPALYP